MARTATVSPIRPGRLQADKWHGFTSFASPHLNDATYEAECLAGRCFPRPGDADMLRRCQDAYRIQQWIELFRRFHMNSYAASSTEDCIFNRYFSPLLPVRPAMNVSKYARVSFSVGVSGLMRSCCCRFSR